MLDYLKVFLPAFLWLSVLVLFFHFFIGLVRDNKMNRKMLDEIKEQNEEIMKLLKSKG